MHHTWELEKPVITNQYYFTYKFAVCDSNGNFEYYEKGIDRIADMEILIGPDTKIGQDLKFDNLYDIKKSPDNL